MSATPSLDALLGAAIRSDGQHYGGSIARSLHGLKRAAISRTRGSGAGRRMLRVDVHPGSLARVEDHGDAAICGHLVLVGAPDLLGCDGEHGACDRVGRATGESH